jgi:cytochrome c553
MKLGRILLGSALVLLTAVGLVSCGDNDAAEKGDPVAGKQLFTSEGCAGCHTFNAAASKGTTGPDLDAVAPSPSRVMLQLRKPGGVMPSFADKLTDEQKADLASFVGAGKASGKPVVAPFKPDSKQLADCRAPDTECFEQSFGNLTYREGAKPALDELQKMMGTNTTVASDCHRIAHRMGSAALALYKDDVAKAFIAGSPVCWSGYYHGIVERAFLGQPDDKLAVVARQLCSDPEINVQRFLAYQCIHGLGHGLMIYTGYDLPGSLKTCDGLKTGFDRVSCSGGVFMENFTSSYGITSKYLRKNDPIYPCNAVAERHKLYCYLLVTSNALHLNGYDLKKAAASCLDAEPNWVSTCYESFGRDVSGLAGQDATKALANCRLATRYESQCLYGVSRDITSSDAGGARAGRFCARAPSRYQGHCYEGVGSVLGSIETTPEGLRASCRKVGGRHVHACLRGGGLEPAQT